jgi:4-hydroxybenzoate polyprenyltransferase
MNYLKLIRYKNLLMLAFMQLVFCFGFLKWQKIDLSLANWQYFLLVLSTVCIAAGGYIINNINDTATDFDNKPDDVIVGKSISEGRAYNLYVAFTLIGVSIGYYLSSVILKQHFVVIFILSASLLYVYATYLKQIMIIGNIVVAFLLSLSILIIGVFMIFPATYDGNKQEMTTVFSILVDFATIAFIINLIREMIKDLEDVNGDKNQGMKTLPIVLGVDRTSKVIFFLSFIPIICILYYVYNYLFDLLYATIYLLGFILGPLLYFSIKLWTAKSSNDFHHLSNVLKWIILFGTISILVISLNMKYHVA